MSKNEQKTLVKVKKYLSEQKHVRRVRYSIENDAWDCYGKMPNSVAVGWWYAGSTDDIVAEIASSND